MRSSLARRPSNQHTEGSIEDEAFAAKPTKGSSYEKVQRRGDDVKSRNEDYESALCAASPPKDVTGGPQVSVVCGYTI